jgi:hypothetical protein
MVSLECFRSLVKVVKYVAKTAIHHTDAQLVQQPQKPVLERSAEVHMFQPDDEIPEGVLSDEDVKHFLEIGAIEEFKEPEPEKKEKPVKKPHKGK